MYIFLNKSYSFLTKYGYLPTPEKGKSYLLSEEGVTNAIRMMQRVGGTENRRHVNNITCYYGAPLYRNQRNRSH